MQEMQSRAEDLERKNLALEHEIEDELNFDELWDAAARCGQYCPRWKLYPERTPLY